MRERFSVVLMDCEMPRLDGFETTRLIRERSGPDPLLPIIALTGHDPESVAGRCRSAGMDDWAQKPLRLEALKELLSRWTGTSPTGPSANEPPTREPGPRPPEGGTVLDAKTWAGLHHLESLTGPGAIADLVEAFLADAPERFRRMENAIHAGELVAAGRDAHDLKANAATLGALRLAGVMAEIEAAARGEGNLDLMMAIPRARTLLEEAQEALSRRMA